MNSLVFNELDFNFQTEPVLIKCDISMAPKRKFDKTLFARETAASASSERALQPDLKRRIICMAEVSTGMDPHLKVVASPQGRPGSSKVLTAPIDIALSQRGAGLTKTACREEVRLRFREFGFYKDWTNELTGWVLLHAKKRIETSTPPLPLCQTSCRL